MKYVLFALALLVQLPLPHAAQSEESIRLGATIPLTGPFATYGKRIMQGLELAQDTLAAQGVKTEIIAEDACLPKEALRAMQKLAYVDRIELLAANFCVIAVSAIAPLLTP